MLIADDSPDYLRVLALLLEPFEGIDVVAAVTNGREAVERLRANDIDVALLDIDMPVVDGFAAAESLRRLASETTVVLQTGCLTESVLRRADTLGLFVFEKFKLIGDLELLAGLSRTRRAA